MGGFYLLLLLFNLNTDTRTNVHYLCKEKEHQRGVAQSTTLGLLAIRGSVDPTHPWVTRTSSSEQKSSIFNRAFRFIVRINAGEKKKKNIPFCIVAFLRKATSYSKKKKKKCGTNSHCLDGRKPHCPKKTNCTMAPYQNFSESCSSSSINE